MLHKFVKKGIPAVLCGLVLFLAGGCEDNATPDTFNHAAPVAGLSISPESTSIGFGITVASFTANGGSPPYSWSVSDSSLGSVPATDASTVTYTRSGAKLGVNVIRVVDQNNWTAQALIYQTAETNLVSGT